MSFQLQQAAIAAELQRAGLSLDAANRLAAILGNSAQQVRSGPSTVDLTPSAMRKITPDIRKYHLTNADFLEGDPDYRKPQVLPSEGKARPVQASSVRTEPSPQQESEPYRVSQGEFTQVRQDGDRVSVGLRVQKTGSFVTQDPTSGALIGRNLVAQSRSGDKGKVRLSIQDVGSDTVFKLDVDEDAFDGSVEEGPDDPVAPIPASPPECLDDADCPEGEICADGACTAACAPDECVTSADCGDPQGGSEPCLCIDGECNSPECSTDEDCPEGEACVDGVCVEVGGGGGGGPAPGCAAVQCADNSDCGAGCVCIAGACVPRGAAYYCCYVAPPVEGQAEPESMCQLGPCFDRDGVTDVTLTKAGPFATYEECCESACGCMYKCEGGACLPSSQGQYGSPFDCLQFCEEGGETGRCCETLPPGTSLNPTSCAIKRPSPGSCTMLRSGCPPEQRDENGVLVISRTWTAGLTCDSCPTTAQGACCLPDGRCETLCQGECEERGGVFKGASWSDCTTERTSSGGLYDFACSNGNGLGDCACAPDERIVDAGPSSRCEPCENLFSGNGDGLVGSVENVSAGDTFDFYVRSCDAQARPLAPPARVITVQVGDGEEQLIGVQGTFTADRDGQLIIYGGAWASVCWSSTPAGIVDRQEVSCVRCCHYYSADFTATPSCPDGWSLLLGDNDGDGIADAPSTCAKCVEQPLGEDDCLIDATDPSVAEMVAHINGSADKLQDVTADDVLSSGVTAPGDHFSCPDGKCYEGVFRAQDCPEGNPLP